MFKRYDQNQVIDLPIELEKLVGQGHLARVVDGLLEQLDDKKLAAHYMGGGAPAYHPKMMLKVWIYGYCTKVYTTRTLAKAIREQIPLMWLSGCNQPGHKTLSNFRSVRMQGLIDTVFKQVLVLLVEQGYIDLEDLYVDGSKWEANANRHKVVWAKNTKRYREAVEDRVDFFLREAGVCQVREDARYGDRDLPSEGEGKDIMVLLKSEEVCAHLTELQTKVAEAADQAQRRKLSQAYTALKKAQRKLQEYEAQERVLAGRNSYARTDTDATVMRTKEEELRPAYNVQHTTCEQFIVNYTIEQSAADAPTLPGHLQQQTERLADLPLPAQQRLCADAGYGSEENYAALDKHGIAAYVKYPGFFYEQRGQLAKQRFRWENFPYDAETDTFTCPQQRTLHFVEERLMKTANGYEKQVRHYQCGCCADCPWSAECKKSPDQNRTITYSPKGEQYKQKAKALLTSEQGQAMRSARSIEVESVFGDLKYNMNHRRFILRGRTKVYIEYGLLAISHNLRKVYCHTSGVWADYYAQRARKRA